MKKLFAVASAAILLFGIAGTTLAQSSDHKTPVQIARQDDKMDKMGKGDKMGKMSKGKMGKMSKSGKMGKMSKGKMGKMSKSGKMGKDAKGGKM